jgi:hypothetical protein
MIVTPIGPRSPSVSRNSWALCTAPLKLGKESWEQIPASGTAHESWSVSRPTTFNVYYAFPKIAPFVVAIRNDLSRRLRSSAGMRK